MKPMEMRKTPRSPDDPQLSPMTARQERLTPRAGREVSLTLARWAVSILTSAKATTTSNRSAS